MPQASWNIDVPEDPGALAVVDAADLPVIASTLLQDKVVLVRGIKSEPANRLILHVGDELGLRDTLSLQAGLAAIRGHRERVGSYFMTVNQRDAVSFIPPHSEGSSLANMQLAAFFCAGNSTDGGVTILMRPKQNDHVWEPQREKVVRATAARPLTKGEIARAKMLYNVDLLEDSAKGDVEVVEERDSEIPGLRLLDALVRTRKHRSSILDRELYVYWDSVGSIDGDSAEQFAQLLRSCDLLREPPTGLNINQLDSAASRRIWRSGVHYEDLFEVKITHRMEEDELIIMNNFTWTHSVSNWTPGSGTRTVVAAFA